MSYAGVYTIDITPPLGIAFIGYHRPNGIEDILDRVTATAFVFMQDAKKTVVISIDNIGMLVEDTSLIREKLSEELHIPKSDIMVLYTHTHSGPATASNNELVQANKKVMIANIVGAAKRANEHLQPCEIGWGVTTGEIGVNRREKGPDGKAKMGTDPNGIVDKRICVLGIKHQQSAEMLGALVFCTAHPNVLMSDSNVLSADYPGRTRELLQSALQCPIAIVQGAAGNVNAKWRGSVEALEKMAQTVAGHSLTVFPTIEYHPITTLSAISDTVPMHLKEVPDAAGIERMAKHAQEQWNVNTDTWKKELFGFLNRNERHLTIPLEIQLLQLNEGAFSGIPMEPFSETAIEIKERLGNELAFFGGYTNGYIGYLPTKEEYLYGGYEVELNPVIYGPITGLWMPPVATTAENVVEKVLELSRSNDKQGEQ